MTDYSQDVVPSSKEEAVHQGLHHWKHRIKDEDYDTLHASLVKEKTYGFKTLDKYEHLGMNPGMLKSVKERVSLHKSDNNAVHRSNTEGSEEKRVARIKDHLKQKYIAPRGSR